MNGFIRVDAHMDSSIRAQSSRIHMLLLCSILRPSPFPPVLLSSSIPVIGTKRARKKREVNTAHRKASVTQTVAGSWRIGLASVRCPFGNKWIDRRSEGDTDKRAAARERKGGKWQKDQSQGRLKT
mmetsp:Transcript_25284/g.49416  ORF Transcript_25284/g.49416 Transcript_25284/m.49416 type:complete len:126 (+) Transcript_25284:2939-3316(+)